MDQKVKNNVLRISAAALGVAALVAAARFGARPAAGILAGGIWNLASLWCLTRMLQAWIGPKPSQKKAVLWVLIKFPLLYSAIYFVFQSRAVPFAAFSAGFSIVLFIAIGAFVVGLRQAAGEAKP